VIWRVSQLALFQQNPPNNESALLFLFACLCGAQFHKRVDSSFARCVYTDESFPLPLYPAYAYLCCDNMTTPNVDFFGRFQSVYWDDSYTVSMAIANYKCDNQTGWKTKLISRYFGSGIQNVFETWNNVPWKNYSAYMVFYCNNIFTSCSLFAPKIGFQGY